MLDAWIIEEIERERRERESNQVPLELPLYEPQDMPTEASPAEESDRGVVTFDYY
jgi:hypothetical protein